MPEIVARCGMRWWNAEGNDIAAIVLRRVVIDNNLGGYGSSYDARRLKAPASEMKAVQHLRLSQQHTATGHMKAASKLIAKLFRQTTEGEPYVNHVKKEVFGIEDGKPILPPDHPVLVGMARSVKGASSIIYFIEILYSHAYCALTQGSGLRSCSKTKSLQRPARVPWSGTVLRLIRKHSSRS